MTKTKRAVRTNTDAHDEKRMAILQHGATLFDQVGYHKASMQMLADEVGLGKPTLYHYFKSKVDILYAIHELHMDALLDGLENLSRATVPPSERLLMACTDILTQIAEHPGYVRAFMDHYNDLEGEMRKKIRTRRNEYLSLISKSIQEGIDSGEFAPRDVELTTFAFLGMCNWAYKWYPRIHKKRPPADVAKELCGTFILGLQARP
jgi:AcrR family transcriptional regulator